MSIIERLRPQELFFLIRFGLPPSRISIQKVIEIIEEDADAYANSITAAQFLGPVETSRLFANMIGGDVSGR